MSKKKKILLLSDDLTMESGVASQSRELVVSTLHKYDWIQVAGAQDRPDSGTVVDWSLEAKKLSGVEDANVKLIKIKGYGDPNLIRQIMITDKPDAILHFTDPRFWMWLYQMEHEVRQLIPILYWNIWDDVPFPYWNIPFYESCDLLMGISMQTYNINKQIAGLKTPREDWSVKYVPHGINTTIYKKHQEDNEDLKKFKAQLFQNLPIEFSILYVNRNIKRKHPSDVILAFKLFCDSLSKEESEKCALIMHTAPIDPNGTDLFAVAETLCPDYTIIFTAGQINTTDLSYLYNSVSVTINMASNEGFGLTTAESLACGTPIIVNVTGGLQDQCGFRKFKINEDGSNIPGELVTTEDFNENWGTNTDGRFLIHGEWVQPIWPVVRTLQGSPETPYIFDDICSYEDAARAIKFWYDKTPDEMDEAAQKGIEFINKEGGLNTKTLGDNAIDAFEGCFNNWKPRQRFDIFSDSSSPKPVGTSGVLSAI